MTEPSLFDTPSAPLHHEPRPTEVEAAMKIERHLGPLLKLVYRDIIRAGSRGLTGDELCASHPDLNPYSLRPRLSQLSDRGLISTKGARPNRRGNGETVWAHPDYL